LRCIAFWLINETFEEMHLVLPVYKYEQNNSYAFLEKYKGKTKIKIYNAFHDMIAHNLIKKQSKSKGKIFLGIDDSTHQKSSLMKSDALLQIATTSRHLHIHTWIILHYNKGVIPPNVRQNLGYVFVFQLSTKPLKDIFEQYIQISKYKTFDDFDKDFSKMCDEYKYACMLIDNIHHEISFDVSSWWEN
jgi:hypothetical protein